jgi:hypothetical protein
MMKMKEPKRIIQKQRKPGPDFVLFPFDLVCAPSDYLREMLYRTAARPVAAASRAAQASSRSFSSTPAQQATLRE